MQRQYSDDQSLEKTFVGLHGNYDRDGGLLSARMDYLKNRIIKYSDSKVNPQLVDQWVHIANHHGYAAFYRRDAQILPNTQKVRLCQETEERSRRFEEYTKSEMGDALRNGIVTTWSILQIKKIMGTTAPIAKVEQGTPRWGNENLLVSHFVMEAA